MTDKILGTVALDGLPTIALTQDIHHRTVGVQVALEVGIQLRLVFFSIDLLHDPGLLQEVLM